MPLAESLQLQVVVSTQTETPLTDLIRRAAAGDTEAFEQIMILSEKRVMAMTWRMLGNEADARDASQEVFLRVYKHLGRYRHNQDFFGWLYAITVNVCRDIGRKRQALVSKSAPIDDESYAIADSGIDAEQTSIETQQRAMIARALATLPEKERAAVVLRDIEGLSTEETAEILSSSPTTVRSQISSARRKIKAFCDRYRAR